MWYFIRENIPIIKSKNEFGILLSNLDLMNDTKNDKKGGKGICLEMLIISKISHLIDKNQGNHINIL